MRPLTKNATNGTCALVLPIGGIFAECSTRHPSDNKFYLPLSQQISLALPKAMRRATRQAVDEHLRCSSLAAVGFDGSGWGPAVLCDCRGQRDHRDHRDYRDHREINDYADILWPRPRCCLCSLCCPCCLYQILEFLFVATARHSLQAASALALIATLTSFRMTLWVVVTHCRRLGRISARQQPSE